jgi:exodeoxyribonuclease VII large subunit
MLKSIYSIVESSNNYLIVNSKGLNHLSPLKTLARGYSITSNENNELLKSTKNIMINDNITTKLSDGVIHSKIHKIENN